MTSVEIRDELQNLISEAEQADDPRLAAKLLHDRISALNAEGKHVPEAFRQIQNRLVKECVYASQGR